MVCEAAVKCSLPGACERLKAAMDEVCRTCHGEVLRCIRCGATAPARPGDTCLVCGLPGGMEISEGGREK